MAYSVLPRFPRALSRSASEQAQEQLVLSPGSCSSWHKDCGFQKKPQGAGASQGWHAFEAKAFGHLCSFDRGQRPQG